MDDDGCLPIGELNSIRRKAIELLENAILEKSKRSSVNINEPFRESSEYYGK